MRQAGRAVDELRRRMANAILPEAGSAHVEELSDPYLLWFWNSNVRSTAIVLNSLVKASARPERDPADRALDDGGAEERPLGQHAGERARDGVAGRVLPPLRGDGAGLHGVAMLGDRVVAREQFKGRSTEAATSEHADGAAARASAPAGTTRPLTFTRDGAGTLFYTARLRYAADRALPAGTRQRHSHRALVRAVRRERHPSGGDDVTRPATWFASR